VINGLYYSFLKRVTTALIELILQINNPFSHSRGISLMHSYFNDMKSVNNNCGLDKSFRSNEQCPETLWGPVKAIPLQAWTGAEGSRKFRDPEFKKIST
jgi:hypothetical protein